MPTFTALRAPLVSIATIVALLSAIGCGDENTDLGAPAADPGTTMKRIVETPPQPDDGLLAVGPQFQYYGGPVLANVQAVAVFWGPNVSSIVRTRIGGFYQMITAAGYMSSLSEYSTVGVPTVDGEPGSEQTIGPGSFAGATTITPFNGSTSLTDAAIRAELDTQIQNNALPAPTANTVYMVHFPPGVRITDRFGGISCGFCAYHDMFISASGAQVPYAVMPDFGPGSGCESCGSGTMFENVTHASSHELVEAVTDPQVFNYPTIARPLAWFNPNLREIGDVCSQLAVCLGGYIVQTEFSNARNACFAPSLPGAGFIGADAIVVNNNQGLVVRRSNGSYFTCNETFTSGAFVGNVGNYFADVTGDGLADAIVVNNNQGVVVRRSTGSSFGPNETWTSNPFVGNVGNYFADVDQDGKADAIVVNNNQGVVVRRSTGSSFGPNENWTSNPFVGNVGNFFADVTNDQRADAIVVNSTQGVVVRRSTGSSFSGNETWTSNPFVGNRGNFFADVTGDGRADAIVVNNNQGVVVRRSTGSSFSGNETWTSNPFTGSVGNYFADVTGDGLADAIVVNSGQGVVVRRSTGSSFSANENWTDNPFVGNVKNFFVDVDRPRASGSCLGFCGGSPGGCFCDAVCTQFGDCCGDKIPICGP